MANSVAVPSLVAPESDLPQTPYPIDTMDEAVASVIAAPPDPAPTMQSSVAQAISTNPDTEAELRRVAARTGVPIQTADTHFEQMKQRAALNDIDFEGYQKMFPASAAALSNLDLAKLAHDDTENMGVMEKTMRSLYSGAAPTFAQGFYGALETGTALTQEYITRPANRALGLPVLPDLQDTRDFFNSARRGAIADRQRAIAPVMNQSGYVGKGIYSGVESLGNMLPSTLLAVATGNSAPALITGGITQGGQSAGAALDAGRSPINAAIYGISDAAVEVGTEYIPMARLIGDTKAGSGFLKTLLHQATAEVPGELVATTLQNLNEWVVLNPEKPFSDYLKALPADLGTTLISTLTAVGMQTGATHALGRLARRQEEATQAEQSGQHFETLDATAAESKLRGRDPLAFQNFIEQVAQTDGAIENVYLDPRALAQSGVNLEELAKVSPSIADQVAVAIETGTDIKIPVSEYASHLAGTELGQSMIDHLKTDPLKMSRAESQEFMQTYADKLQADVERTVSDQGVDDTFVKSADVVREDLVKKLGAARRFTDDVNNQYATLLSNFYKVQAARLGTTPEALYAQHPVDIQSVIDKGSTLDQRAPQLTPAINWKGRVYKADTHLDALSQIPKEERAAATLDGDNRVYVTERGKVYDRFQAQEYAKNYGLFREDAPNWVHTAGELASEYLKPVEKTLNQNQNKPEFYSALERNLGELNQPKGSPEQWAGIIKNLTQKGVKQEEIDWLGIQDWLKSQKGSVTKEQVLEYIRANQIQVKEVMKSSEPAEATQWSIEGREDDGFYAVNDATGERITEVFDDRYAAETAAEDVAGVDRFGGDTKFDNYTLPGGKNYRELLMTLPKISQTGRIEKEGKYYVVYDPSGSAVAFHDNREQAEKQLEQFGTEEYRSSHYPDEKNIVAHLRFNEREDAEGAKTLFVEEIQSDWHQAGRDKGYRDENARLEINRKFADLDSELRQKVKERTSLEDDALLAELQDTQINKDWDRKMADLNAQIFDIQREQQALRDEMNVALRGVPDAPFKTSWAELAFKRALMYAVENGYDKVAWTTGEQQAERYDLSKQVDEIAWERNKDGTYGISVFKDDKVLTEFENKTPEQLAEIIGKEAAKKIIDSPGEKHPVHGGTIGSLTGENLKVGGEGMKGFYDNILPKMVNKLVKKWGGKVGEATLEENGGQYKVERRASGDKPYVLTKRDSTEVISRHATADEAWAAAERLGNLTVHSLEITPAMRESVKGGLPLFQDKAESARGSFNPDTSTITLLQNADLSTFLHESGHFFLETMNKLAMSPDAPEGIKQDMQTTLDWLGVKDLAEWNAHDLEWQREKHEQFARGFEAYLFEGKSPSIEMRGVFQRFRAWLLNVYRHLTALNVQLTDEVRGVFDRMLATTEQIKEAEIARNFEPMFTDARAAGMTPDEWRQYQELGLQASQDAITDLETRSLRDMKFLSNAKSRALKDLQREAAGRRREVRDQVTKEVMSEPINQARRFLTKGEFEIPDDANKELKRQFTEAGLGATKLSLPALKEMYGEEANAPWRYFSTGKNGEVGTQGLHPDQVAEMFGFSSGDELVRTLLAAEKPRDKIAGLTDQRMLEKYGDITNPEVLSRAADEAVHNEVRARFVASELNALQKATGGRKILAEAARTFAENAIARTKIRNLSPAFYTAAETRSAKAAMDSLKAGGLAAAAVEKRNQLINNYAAKATYAAQSEVERAVQYFKKFDKKGSRENIATSSLDQIDALLERFDLRKGQSLKAIDKRASMMEWKASQEEIGLEPEIPPELLNEAMRKHYKDMTVEELRGLRDTIKQIEHIGRLKNKLLTAKDKREFQAVVDGMVASITANAKGRVVDNRTRANKLGAAMRLFNGFVAQHRKVASLARELDGFKDAGPVWETLIRTMNESGDKEASMREKATKDLAKIVTPILDGGKMGGKGRFFPSVGKSLNREERIGMALNMGNEGNKQRLLDGEGWTKEQLQPVLDTLTKADWDFVQNVWDFFEKFRPEIGAKEKRVYGKEPDWISPSPVQTIHGEYRGGYYPIKYDTRRSIAAEQHEDADYAKQQMKGAYTSATTRRSFTKTRADEVKNRPLLYAMDGLYSGVNEIIHDLSWHEWLIDVNRLLKNKALDNAIRTGYGADVTRQFKDAVKDIAGGEMPNGSAFEKAIGDLRSGAVVAGIGFNIVNTVINVTGLTNSVVRIGPKWVAMGVSKFAAHPIETVQMVHEKSEFMRLRSKTLLREVNEIQNQVRGKTRVRAAMDNIMFMPLTYTQIAVDTPTWYGAYQKALTEGHPEDRAIALADQAVLDAQSGGQVKDLSKIQRGGNLHKLWTTFYGYFNATYNLAAEKTNATNFRDPVSVMHLGGTYLMLSVIPAFLGTIINSALTGGDKAWEPEKIAKRLANDQISYLMGMMMGLRDVTGAVQTMAGVNPYTSSYGGPAGLRFFQEFYNLAQQIHQGKADDALRKSVINTAGILFKLPSAQINRTIDGIEALIDGKSQNPLALVAGAPKK